MGVGVRVGVSDLWHLALRDRRRGQFFARAKLGEGGVTAGQSAICIATMKGLEMDTSNRKETEALGALVSAAGGFLVEVVDSAAKEAPHLLSAADAALKSGTAFTRVVVDIKDGAMQVTALIVGIADGSELMRLAQVDGVAQERH